MANYPEGISWVGALDMSGNAAEWVKDWYEGAYYENSPENNPEGPASGENKVLRGGSWGATISQLLGASRDNLNPSEKANTVGFRCAIAPGN